MQMGLGLLDDEAAIARLRVLSQLAQNNRHENQIVEAEAVLLDFEGINHQRQARRQPLKVAPAQSQFQKLGKLRPEHGVVPAFDRCMGIGDRRMLLQFVIELLQGFVDVIAPGVIIVGKQTE